MIRIILINMDDGYTKRIATLDLHNETFDHDHAIALEIKDAVKQIT